MQSIYQAITVRGKFQLPSLSHFYINLFSVLQFPSNTNVLYPQHINYCSLMMASPHIKEAQAMNFVAAMVPEASKARVEIEEFIGNNEMTNLYLLALEALQKEDATKSVAKKNEDWWTFYSLSGEMTNYLSGKNSIH